MATHDDDFVRLNLSVGSPIISLKGMGLEWPPPERITEIHGSPLSEPMVRVSMSQLTDEQAEHPNIARGAEYFYESQVPDDR